MTYSNVPKPRRIRGFLLSPICTILDLLKLEDGSNATYIHASGQEV
ncbi:MAG: hypothetical protein AAGJ37_02595 [Pseudomonadota bacterium]